METGKSQLVTKGEAGDIVSPRFSPDGKWIAYATVDGLLRWHVYVMPAAGGEAHHVGSDDEMFAETSPAWAPDGKHLLFLSGVSQQGSATLNRPNGIQLYSVSLQKEEKNPTERGLDGSLPSCQCLCSLRCGDPWLEVKVRTARQKSGSVRQTPRDIRVAREKFHKQFIIGSQVKC